MKWAVKRRRHRAVINNLNNMACHVTEHARKLTIGLGKSNVWRNVFQHVYYAFEYFAPNLDDNRMSATRIPVGTGLVS